MAKFEKENYSNEEESEIYEPRVLTDEEANQCLRTLGRTISNNYAFVELDVSYRNLTDVRVIPSFRYVRYVNVSGNKLTSEAFQVLETMQYLEKLQADQNLLISAELRPMDSLQELTLNQNKLTFAGTSVISHKFLKYLELNYNLINTVVFEAEELPNLTILELRDNALITTAGICCSNLRRLFLAKNQIEKIEDLGNLQELKTIHLRSNNLVNLDGFSDKCRNLVHINLRDNKISKISELKKLSCLKNLETLIIRENPFLLQIGQEEEGRKYRHIVLAMLPRLKRIDKEFVLDQERNEAKKLLETMRKEERNFTYFDLKD
ncbi:leucine-rich repeat-containing protein 23-like [Nylanderia fulva]|uniref:leucine-rich repeat-containing protein 23-like n=1 Tax=Nylanderia fulva TaxID=613905 RepID=UPI0010FAD227|nr:leucine-rich repeat-containing protein 23-like [Nylanderia fulva]